MLALFVILGILSFFKALLAAGVLLIGAGLFRVVPGDDVGGSMLGTVFAGVLVFVLMIFLVVLDGLAIRWEGPAKIARVFDAVIPGQGFSPQIYCHPEGEEQLGRATNVVFKMCPGREVRIYGGSQPYVSSEPWRNGERAELNIFYGGNCRNQPRTERETFDIMVCYHERYRSWALYGGRSEATWDKFARGMKVRVKQQQVCQDRTTLAGC
ncbi:MAG: hypothetical protein AAF511_11730 [Pseudomonadota bacterium]